jgi:hypothetical protein
MPTWIGLGVVAAVVAVIVALGTAASLRYGLWGRRITAGLVVLWVVASMTPNLGERAFGSEAHAITSLRAINAAQLLYASTYGRYADTLQSLVQQEPRPFLTPDRLEEAFRRGYLIELIADARHYVAIAIPQVTRPRPRGRTEILDRAFCVGASGTIYWAPRGTAPVVDAGRCGRVWKPIQ